MKLNKYKNPKLYILMTGLIFSATFGFKYNLAHGLELKGFWISIPIQFLDFAVTSSNQLFLTSQLIGYLFYFIFGILCMKYFGSLISNARIMLIIYFGLIGIVFLSEIYSIYQDLNNQFTGRHFRIGFTVFLLGLAIFNNTIVIYIVVHN